MVVEAGAGTGAGFVISSTRKSRLVLLQNARVDEDYVLKLLPELPEGDSELYSHPSLDEFKAEFDALMSPRVKKAGR